MGEVRNRFIYTVILLLYLQDKTNAGVFECWDNDECAPADAECKQNRCICPAQSILSQDGSKCLDLSLGNGEPCEEDEQCGILGMSYECHDKKCRYKSGWVYQNGVVIKKRKVLEYCENDEDCYDGIDYFSRKCEKNKCKCSEGYYPRADVDCRKKAELGEECLVNSDCNWQLDNFCDNGKCEKEAATDVGLYEVELDVDTNEVKKPCTSNTDCEDIKHSHCSPLFGQCVCDKKYYFKLNACEPELGNICNNDEDCNSLFSKCLNGKCACSGRYVNSPDNRKCLKGATNPDFFCSSDDSCVVFGSNYKCLQVGNTFQKVCVCNDGCKPNDLDICQCSGSGGSRCVFDEQCELTLPNSFCANTGACVCHDGYEYDKVASKCFPLIGNPCKLDEDCSQIENSRCRSETCMCVDGYTAEGDKKCIKVSSGVGGTCTSHLECSGSVPGSYCQDGNCACQEGYLLFKELCLKKAEKLGDFCTLETVCSTLGTDVNCQNSYCQCEHGKKPSADGKFCIGAGMRSQVYGPLIFVVLVRVTLLFL